VQIGGLMTILRRYRWWLLLAPLAGLLAAFALLGVTAPTYTATGAVFVDPRSRKIVTDEIIQGGFGTDASLVESQVAIIASDNVLRRVVEAEQLDEDPEFTAPPATGLVADIKAAIRGPRPVVDAKTQALEALARTVRVKRPAKSYVLEIEASSSTPAKAARIVNAVMTSYLEDQTAAKAEEANRANTLIDARIGELREQVRKAETRLDEFRKANQIVVSEGGIVAEQQLGKLNIELATARSVAAEAKARFEQARAAARSGTPDRLPEAVKSGLVQKLREQYSQIARREAALAQQLKRRHPVLIDVRSQLDELQDQIDAELGRIAASARSEEAIAAARQREILEAIEAAKAEVARSNTAQIKMRELEQDLGTSRELLGSFIARAKETLEQAKLSTPEARIITPAGIPTRPSFPAPLLFLALGLLGGLGVAIARALIGDALDPSVRPAGKAPSRMSARGGAAEPRAVLPHLGSGSALGRVQSWFSGGGDRSPGFADILDALSDPRDKTGRAYAQAVQRLLGSVRAKPGTATGPWIVAVAAPRAGCGASSTALALAYAAALAGERTLLVDAASANADLSGIFAPALDPGTVVVLDDKDDLAKITTRDVRSGLSFLPIALADIRRLKTSQRRRLADGLSALAQSYDFVFIDAGPLLEDEAARTLLPLADEILLVARPRRTAQSDLEEVEDLVASLANAPAGLVFNMNERGS
jgi:uncharacterized protein involved in exopolysaccharide biosynthesis/Mrp family chromosome partitioning ATPase